MSSTMPPDNGKRAPSPLDAGKEEGKDGPRADRRNVQGPKVNHLPIPPPSLSLTSNRRSSTPPSHKRAASLDVNVSSDPTFQNSTPALTRVSLERDALTEENHKALDADLMDTFSLFRSLDKEPSLAPLLSTVTLGDKRLVTLAPNDSVNCLPYIMTALQKAWKRGSFKEIRQLGVFTMRFLPSCTHKHYHRGPLA
jgi:hypothetical protein